MDKMDITAMNTTVDLPVPKCPQCRQFARLLREARNRISDLTTGVNRELIAEIDATLDAAK